MASSLEQKPGLNKVCKHYSSCRCLLYPLGLMFLEDCDVTKPIGDRKNRALTFLSAFQVTMVI